MTAPTDRELDDIAGRATRIAKYNYGPPSTQDIRTVVTHDVPRLVAEIKRLRAGLHTLAESPGAQEVVSTDGLRIGGESGALVHNGSFAATYAEDLAAYIEKLLGGKR